jgi:hypothetical protein
VTWADDATAEEVEEVEEAELSFDPDDPASLDRVSSMASDTQLSGWRWLCYDTDLYDTFSLYLELPVREPDGPLARLQADLLALLAQHLVPGRETVVPGRRRPRQPALDPEGEDL